MTSDFSVDRKANGDFDVLTGPTPAPRSKQADVDPNWKERSAELRLARTGGMKGLQTSNGAQPLDEFS